MHGERAHHPFVPEVPLVLLQDSCCLASGEFITRLLRVVCWPEARARWWPVIRRCCSRGAKGGPVFEVTVLPKNLVGGRYLASFLFSLWVGNLSFMEGSDQNSRPDEVVGEVFLIALPSGSTARLLVSLNRCPLIRAESGPSCFSAPGRLLSRAARVVLDRASVPEAALLP